MQKAFTLLELLIVITILAILAGAMMPLFKTTKYEAELAKVHTDQDVLKKAAVMYHYDTGCWPRRTTTGDCIIDNSWSYCPKEQAGWRGPYLTAWVNDPWGKPYMIYDPDINPCSQGRSARYICSGGPNKIFDDCTGITNSDDIVLLMTQDDFDTGVCCQ